jgi:hypothetical protein
LTNVSGSYATTGSNTFIGDQAITGSLSISGSTFTAEGISWPLVGSEKHLFKINPYTLNLNGHSRDYGYMGIALEHREEDPGYYHNSLLIYSYDSHDNPQYGTEFNVGPLRQHMRVLASGSGQIANISIQDTEDGNTRALLYANDIQIGAYTGSQIIIGNNESTNYLNGQQTIINTPISSSNHITASKFYGDGSSLIFNGTGIVSGSSQIDVNQTQNFQTFSSSVDSRLDEIEGPLSSSIDQQLTSIHSYTSSLKTAIDVSGQNLTVLGNLTVQGTQTSLNTTEVLVEDILLALASGSTTSIEADGGGIFISGANASMTWNHLDQLIEFNTKISSSVGFKGDGTELTGVTAAEVEFDDILNKPTLVSGSSQIDLTQTTNYESGIKDRLDSEGIFSSSIQVNADEITNFDSNVKDKLNSDNVHSGSYLGTATTSNLDEGIQLYYTNDRVKAKLNAENVISSSQQIIDDGVFLKINGDSVVSGSSQIDLTQTTNYISGIKDRLNFEGVLSGSSQVTESLDTRYLEINGDSVISSSQQISDYNTFLEINGDSVVSGSSQIDITQTQNYTSFSSSIDSRLDSVETDQHTHTNKTNLDTIDQNLSTSDTPTFANVSLTTLSTLGSGELNAVFSGSSGTLGTRALGTAAFLHYSQSISNEDDTVIGTAGAMKRYIDEQLLIIGAGDITKVTAGDGISGGADSGEAILNLDTGSTHFIDGVNGIVSIGDGVVSGSSQITISETTGFTEFSGSVSSSIADAVAGATWDNLNGKPAGIVSGSSQIDINQTQNFIPFSSSIDSRLDTLEGETYENPLTFSDSTTIDFIRIGDDITANVIGGIVSSSAQISGYNTFLEINGMGVVSGSSQIIGGSGILSSSVQDFDTFSSSVDLRLDSQESFSSSIDTTIKTKLNTENVISGSSQVDLEQTTNYVSGIKTRLNAEGVISGSDQILLGSGIVSSSEQISNYNTFLEINGDSVVSSSQQISNYNTFLEKTGDGVISGSDQLTGSLVDIESEQTITGTKTFNDIVVNGTGSFAYITSVAGDAKIIGDSFIILNNNTPTQRYAGISVQDSGSANTTASLQFDGQTNDWFYQYSDDGGVTTDHGVVLFGPEYSGIGNPTYPTNNRIQKGNGAHHLLDSNITDNGTLITLGSNVQVNGNIELNGTVDGIDLQNFSSSVDGRLDTLEETSNENPLTFNDTATIDFTRVGDTITAKAIGGIVSSSAQIDGLGFLKVDGDGVISGSTFSSPSQGTLRATINGVNQDVDLGLQTGDTVQFGKVGVGGASDATYELKVTGDIGATGDVVAYVSSDERLKDEITPIENSLQKINSIGGYSFVWNEKQNIYKGKDYGVIAQEIEEILPELVETRENGYKAVKYDRIVSLLIEGVKELSKEVSELKKQIGK